MTRDEQIAMALRLIGTDNCRADVEQMLDIIADETVETASKATKAEVQVIYNALRKIRSTGIDLIPDLDKHLHACDLILRTPSKPQAEKQRLAAAAAQELLMTHGGRLTATRGGQWDQLTAILFGDPKADMFQYIRGQKTID
jgi:hypothetical protein